jgi:hypothetical protein
LSGISKELEAKVVAGLEEKESASYPTNFNLIITKWLAEKDAEALRNNRTDK